MSPWNTAFTLASALVLTAGATVATSAQTPSPVFWTWEQPEGNNAPNHPSIIEAVRVLIGSNSGATTAADVLDEIDTRQLTAGKVCIILQHFGRGDGDPSLGGNDYQKPALFRHWCDSLQHAAHLPANGCCDHIGTSVDEWWMTLWMSEGIAECGGWMDDFIEAYVSLQGLQPDPTRFAFDSERLVVPHFYATGTLEAFDWALDNDARWDTEAIPGFGTDTLDDLYNGTPTYDETLSWNHTDNRDWSVWFIGLAMTAMDAAMDEAAYSKIRAVWSNALCSNYATSVRVDGLGTEPRLVRQRNSHGASWYKWAQDGSGDLQAPVFYPVHSAHDSGSETHEEASVRWSRQNVEAMIDSFGGAKHEEITPWIAVVGQTFGIDYHEATKDYTRRLLTMLRGKGIVEFLAWSGGEPTSTDWDHFADVIDQVWGATLNAASVITGTGVNTLLPLLDLSHSDYFAVASTAVAPNTVIIELEFDTDFDTFAVSATGDLRVIIEGLVIDASNDVDLSVYLYDWTAMAFEQVGATATLANNTRTHLELETALGDDYIDGSGNATMRVKYVGSDAFTSRTDIVQLVEADD